MSPFSRGRDKIFLNILKIALTEQIINLDEIIYGYLSDNEIYGKIKSSNNPHIKILINLLESNTLYTFTNNDNNPKLIKTNAKINRKLRCLNPILKLDGKNFCIISDLDREIGTILREKLQLYEKQVDLFIETVINPLI